MNISFKNIMIVSLMGLGAYYLINSNEEIMNKGKKIVKKGINKMKDMMNTENI